MRRLAWLLLPVAELYTAVLVAHQVGARWTVLVLAAGSAGGLGLLRRTGRRTVRSLATGLMTGQAPSGEAARGLGGALGALLLAAPGFLTGIAGLLVLLPGIRGRVGRRISRALQPRPGSHTRLGGGAAGSGGRGPAPGHGAGPAVIEGEVLGETRQGPPGQSGAAPAG